MFFSSLFQKHYFHTLQQRPKWLKEKKNLKVGDLVLIKEEMLPPLKWAMGRITKTMPGKDGLVRVCEVKTNFGYFTRPIGKLAPLPIEENESIVETTEPNSTDQAEEENETQIVMMPLILSTDDDTAETINAKRRINIIVEGNIGAGKTTLLRYFDELNESRILTFREPVEQWSNFNGANLLDLMYSNRSNWAFPFQSFALLTMLKNHQADTEQKIKIMERSIFSSRIFLEANQILGAINPIQVQILNCWYDFIIRELPIHTDLIIYLRTTPETLMHRIKTRNRPEERDMDVNYLQLIHQLHEDWLIHQTKGQLPAPVRVIDGNQRPDEIIEQLKLIDIPGLWRMHEN